MGNTEPTAHVPAATEDEQATLLAGLRDLVPGAFPDGVLDSTALLKALSTENDEPGFAFTWPGMEEAKRQARAPTAATLVPDEAASVRWPEAQDVLIEGDNLQVLKLLKNGYAGSAKLVYVDPPYNTGDTFTYNDDFSVSEAEYLKSTGQVDAQGATVAKREVKGRKHAPWLTMMFPRLVAARALLRRDGVFLASIDNNEVHHLRLLLDAIFGAENFVDMLTWEGARKGHSKLTGGGQDFILVYARDLKHLEVNGVRWRERKAGLEAIYAKADELRALHGDDTAAMTAAMREWYRSLADGNPSKEHDQYVNVDQMGVWYPGDVANPDLRPNLKYEYKGFTPPENGWRWEQPVMEELDASGQLQLPEDKTKRPILKAYLHKREYWAPGSVFYRDRRGASAALDALMGAKVFEYPKSTDVLARLVEAMTGDGDLVVDFFAGSGSTGHAVWEQNQKDGKTRHWLLVQRPETPDATTESGKKALAEGYTTIFEITAERLRRAAKQFDPDGETLGFRVFRARESNLHIETVVVRSADADPQAQLELLLAEAAKPPVKDGADGLAVAWEVALKATDTRLDNAVVVRDVGGVEVFEFTNRANGGLYLSFGAFTLDTAEALGLTDDDTLILRGDRVEDKTTLTLAPRLRSKLILLERTPREVSL